MVQNRLLLQLPNLLFWLLVLAVVAVSGWQCYQFWQTTQTPLISKQAITSEAPASMAGRNALKMAQVHLFGNPAAQPQTKQPEPKFDEALPTTSLKLTLRGVSVEDQNGHSGALIEEDGRNTQFYQLGATLPGNAKLEAIYVDRIVLERNGRFENLYFPEFDPNSAIAAYIPEDEPESYDDDYNASDDAGITLPQTQDPQNNFSPEVVDQAVLDARKEELKQRLMELRQRQLAQ